MSTLWASTLSLAGAIASSLGSPAVAWAAPKIVDSQPTDCQPRPASPRNVWPLSYPPEQQSILPSGDRTACRSHRKTPPSALGGRSLEARPLYSTGTEILEFSGRPQAQARPSVGCTPLGHHPIIAKDASSWAIGTKRLSGQGPSFGIERKT